MLPARLKIALGQHSHRGRKEINQDFHGACIPDEPQLTAKGIAVAVADGVSSSNVSQVASEATVKSFLDDYYCTSGAWSVRQSAQRVLMAINSWLYAQTRQSQYRYDQDRGYVCTVSAVVIKSTTAHIFHDIHDAVTIDIVIGKDFRGGRIAFAHNGQKDVLGADIFIFEAVGLFIGKVDDLFETRCKKDLRLASCAVNGRGARTFAEDFINTGAKHTYIDSQTFQ